MLLGRIWPWKPPDAGGGALGVAYGSAAACWGVGLRPTTEDWGGWGWSWMPPGMKWNGACPLGGADCWGYGLLKPGCAGCSEDGPGEK